MESGTTLLMLTADQRNVEYVLRLSVVYGIHRVKYQSDPSEFAKMVLQEAKFPDNQQVEPLGMLVDLTSPESQTSHRTSHDTDKTSRELACYLGLLLGKLHAAFRFPLVLIGADLPLNRLLRSIGIDVIQQVSSSVDEAEWRQALKMIAVHLRTAALGQDKPMVQGQLKAHLSHVIRLSAYLSLNLDSHSVANLNTGCANPLTAQEVRLLSALLQAPRRYFRTPDLASRLTRPGMMPVSSHSVEQTVSELRQKLGESGRESSIIRSRRGLGYGIFPSESEFASCGDA